MTETVLYERRGHIARVVLNNPERHNAVGQDVLDGLGSALTSVAADSQVRVLVLTGAGEKTFCAGAALGQVGAGDLPGDSFQAVTDQLQQLAIPTVCSLNGSVYGFGVELALSCDFRIGVQGSRMRVPAAAIGICYTPGGIQRVVQHLGLNVARRLLVAAEQFDAEDMLHVDFLDHLVLPAQLQTFTDAFAADIAELAPLSVRAMKELVQQAAANGIDPARAAELARLCADSDDIREGLAAQGEKRKPRFSGN
jgi:enoyl-CoA hydratase/carnithine racemase